jgi:hypothetical protein
MLVAFGGSFGGLGVPLHGEIIYATGDDDATDSDIDNYYVIPGACYYWSEIMGYGTFDNATSNGSPGCGITNITAINVGASFKPSDKVKVTVDLWNASLNEEDGAGETSLGTEFDVKLTYKLIEGMNLDVVVAYLSAGEATGEENPMEVGTRLSMSF